MSRSMPNPDVDFAGWGNSKYGPDDWRRWSANKYARKHPPCKFCGIGTDGEEYHQRCLESKKRLSQRLSKTASQIEPSKNAQKDYSYEEKPDNLEE